MRVNSQNLERFRHFKYMESMAHRDEENGNWNLEKIVEKQSNCRSSLESLQRLKVHIYRCGGSLERETV